MQFLWKGILIGIMFGIPVGTVGTMTIQRTLTYGVKSGIITGLGSSFADCLYAFIGTFGLTFISEFLLRYERWINVLGGSFLLLMGISMIRKQEKKKNTQMELSTIKTFIPAFIVGITNPVVILTFLFAFTFFEIPSPINFFEGVGLIFGIFLGTLFWWIILSVFVEIMKHKRLLGKFSHRNQVFGILYILFGIAVFARIIM